VGSGVDVTTNSSFLGDDRIVDVMRTLGRRTFEVAPPMQ
jgi:hypothetical protein